MAIATSSGAALPALSPIPWMAPSTWQDPFRTPASMLDTASPSSPSQRTLMAPRSMFDTLSRMAWIREPNYSGTM
jgi:hypothetical protein